MHAILQKTGHCREPGRSFPCRGPGSSWIRLLHWSHVAAKGTRTSVLFLTWLEGKGKEYLTVEEVDEDPGDLSSVLGSATNSPCDLKEVTSSLCASFPFCKVWRA